MEKRISVVSKLKVLALGVLCMGCVVEATAQKSLLWKFAAGGAIHSSPVVSANSIYFGSGDMNLYALDKVSGKLNWKFETKGEIHSSPTIYEDKVIFSSADGNIYSVDKNKGSLVWKFKTKGEKRYDLWDYYLSSPTVYDKVVYMGSGDSSVYAISVGTGKKLWSYKTNGIVHANPVVKGDAVYVGSFDGTFYALDRKNGKLLWKFKTVGDASFPKGEVQNAALVQDNTVLFGSRDYNIYALDAKTGTGKWNMKERGSWIIATPFFYKDNVYFGTSDTHQFYCLGVKTGKIKWTLPLNMRVYGTASLMDDNIVFGCFNGKVYFVDPHTGAIKSTFQTEESKARYASFYDDKDHIRSDIELYGKDYINVEKQILSLGSILSSPLVDGHRLYFGDTNGFFYALDGTLN